MAKLPTVAIIGRPNTGKSTLFNRLIGRRKAIVSDIPGTTRDHIAHRIETETIDYLLIDTGGMGGGTADADLEDDVHGQSRLALENADLIILTLNSTEELTSSDHEIIDLLRKEAKQHVPVIIAVTKCDTPEEIDSILPQYYAFEIADTVIGVSAPHKIGLDDLQKEIVKHLKELDFKKSVEETNHLPTIAIVGKPNVGKSSIINAFMSETQRAKSPLLVSEIPGTTRDSTDTIIKYHDQEYRFIDTAGIKRRKQTVEKEVEVAAYFRSVHSIQECDICVLVLNATEELSRQDKRIANLVIEEGKGLIILVNKIDIASKDERTVIMQFIEHELQFCKYAPVLPCSAETREGLLKLFDLIEAVDRNRKRRVETKDLREWFQSTVAGQPLGPLVTSKHITQAEEVPPTFVIFVREAQKVQISQLRHLENSIRKTFAFEGTPVRWIVRES